VPSEEKSPDVDTETPIVIGALDGADEPVPHAESANIVIHAALEIAKSFLSHRG
jgi:hypothetical protein